MKTMRVLWLIGLVWLTLPAPGWAFYNPEKGRWLNRDPIEEKGALNLCGFVANNPLSRYDRLGQDFPGGDRQINPTKWPNPDGYDTSCCCKKEAKKGLAELNDRFSNAVKYLADRHTKPDADGSKPNTLSCQESAEAILGFMKPTPPCWICFLEQRGPWLPGGYWHYAVVCIRLGYFDFDAVYFDWFGGETTGRDYALFKLQFPTTMKTYPENPEAAYNDCSKQNERWNPDYTGIQRKIDYSKLK